MSHYIDSSLILCVDTGTGFHNNELFDVFFFLSKHLYCQAGRGGGGPCLEGQCLLGSPSVARSHCVF